MAALEPYGDFIRELFDNGKTHDEISTALVVDYNRDIKHLDSFKRERVKEIEGSGASIDKRLYREEQQR